MSRKVERLEAQAAYERDVEQRIAERPNVEPRPFNPDRTAWDSSCAGNRSMRHTRAGVETDPADGLSKWRCRWCWQLLMPPPGVNPDRAPEPVAPMRTVPKYKRFRGVE